MKFIKTFESFQTTTMNESNLVVNSKVDAPKFHVGDIVRVSFQESHWDRRKTPYIAIILDVKKEIGFNNNEYFDYEVSIVTSDIDASDFYNTKTFHKDRGEIHHTTEEDIGFFYENRA